MKANITVDGMSLITSRAEIKDIEAHCRKIHSEAVIMSFVIAFSAPIKAADKLFFSPKETLATRKAPTS